MVFLVCLVFQHNVALHASVPSPSMSPTVEVGDHLFVNCLTYKIIRFILMAKP